MSTFIQQQHDILNFLEAILDNAMSLRKYIDKLYFFQRDLTAHESEIYHSIFKHRYYLTSKTENHAKKMTHMSHGTPSQNCIHKLHEELVAIISHALNQIVDIQSKITKLYGSTCDQYTPCQKKIAFILSSQKLILESRLRKEQAKISYL